MAPHLLTFLRRIFNKFCIILNLSIHNFSSQSQALQFFNMRTRTVSFLISCFFLVSLSPCLVGANFAGWPFTKSSPVPQSQKDQNCPQQQPNQAVANTCSSGSPYVSFNDQILSTTYRLLTTGSVAQVLAQPWFVGRPVPLIAIQ